jgi:hypothetical protein
LVSLLDEFAAPPNGIYAVFAQRKHLPLRVRLWIDFLKHTYGDATYWRSAAISKASARQADRVAASPGKSSGLPLA